MIITIKCCIEHTHHSLQFSYAPFKSMPPFMPTPKQPLTCFPSMYMLLCIFQDFIQMYVLINFFFFAFLVWLGVMIWTWVPAVAWIISLFLFAALCYITINMILFYRYTKISLSTHLLDIWIVSSCWLLQTKLNLKYIFYNRKQKESKLLLKVENQVWFAINRSSP